MTTHSSVSAPYYKRVAWLNGRRLVFYVLAITWLAWQERGGCFYLGCRVWPMANPILLALTNMAPLLAAEVFGWTGVR